MKRGWRLAWWLTTCLAQGACDSVLDPLGRPAAIEDPFDPPPYPAADPCAGQTCSDHGRCEVNPEGWPQCACDGGYVALGLSCTLRPAGGRLFGPCDVPVPDHVTITRPVWGESPVHFYVPNHSWALAVAHASRELADLADDHLDLRLQPSFFFALGLDVSFLGCDDSVGADPLHPEHTFQRLASTNRDGCFQIQTTTAWDEITKLYPQFQGITHAQVISADGQGQTGRANFETSALAVPYLATFNYALLTLHGVPDPDAWFAGATDPLALEKLVALAYNQGAWSPLIKNALDNCQKKSIEQCLTGDSAIQDFVKSVSSHSLTLEQAVRANQCHGGDLDTATLRSYLERLRPLFPTEDWTSLTAKAEQAFREASGGAASAPFQQVAPAVLEVLHTQMSTRLRCPGQKLTELYDQSCPP